MYPGCGYKWIINGIPVLYELYKLFWASPSIRIQQSSCLTHGKLKAKGRTLRNSGLYGNSVIGS